MALTRASTGSGRRGAARAFTLIEVVIALGLVVLLAGLAMPTLVGLTGGAVISESESRVESVAAICRAEAMRRGQVIELSARENADGVTVLLGRRADEAPVSGGVDGAAGEVAPGGPGEDESGRSDPWPAFLVEALPRGCAVLEAEAEEKESPGRVEDGGTEMLREEVLIAAFLPSGAAAVKGETKLRAQDGRESSIGVNRWTGTVRTARILPKAEDEAGAAGGLEENMDGEAGGR